MYPGGWVQYNVEPLYAAANVAGSRMSASMGFSARMHRADSRRRPHLVVDACSLDLNVNALGVDKCNLHEHLKKHKEALTMHPSRALLRICRPLMLRSRCALHGRKLSWWAMLAELAELRACAVHFCVKPLTSGGSRQGKQCCS